MIIRNTNSKYLDNIFLIVIISHYYNKKYKERIFTIKYLDNI